jgi:uncharacterized membrane protein
MDSKKAEMIFLVISWIFGIYFLIIFHINRGFPPKIYFFDWDLLFLCLGILLFLIPFAKIWRYTTDEI